MRQFPLYYFRKMKPDYHIGHHYVMNKECKKPPQGTGSQHLKFTIETEQETDGRWIAEVMEVPGALAYGKTIEEATKKAYAIALRSIADDLENTQKEVPASISVGRRIA